MTKAELLKLLEPFPDDAEIDGAAHGKFYVILDVEMDWAEKGGKAVSNPKLGYLILDNSEIAFLRRGRAVPDSNYVAGEL